jgi:ceramide glucosyltransferase
MTMVVLVIGLFVVVATAVHLATLCIVGWRFHRRPTATEPRMLNAPAVSVVRPVCGVENFAVETLRSTFALNYPNYEILFCVASAADPAIPLINELLAGQPGVDARLLVGDERVNSNPKLNNVLKGWWAARHDWIVMADSNVLMPPDFLDRLFADWRSNTGLVASPPIGSRPNGVWAELECAFLNTYQARWTYMADACGSAFAHGKTMLWRRADLDEVGGIELLGREIAEDAAATKLIRSSGRTIQLVGRPFPQPLGHRSALEVWNRQVRWARLRRASFFAAFLPEGLAGSALPMIALAVVATFVALPVIPTMVGFALVWYGTETMLAIATGWHVSIRYPLLCMARDAMLPVLFVTALQGNKFEWRGNSMQVAPIRSRVAPPRGRRTIFSFWQSLW